MARSKKSTRKEVARGQTLTLVPDFEQMPEPAQVELGYKIRGCGDRIGSYAGEMRGHLKRGNMAIDPRVVMAHVRALRMECDAMEALLTNPPW